MPRNFYRTTYTYVVLSEEPMSEGMSLADVAFECDEGDCVGNFVSGQGVENPKVEILTGAEMATVLVEAGSEPAFFSLNDDGSDYDDDE